MVKYWEYDLIYPRLSGSESIGLSGLVQQDALFASLLVSFGANLAVNISFFVSVK